MEMKLENVQGKNHSQGDFQEVCNPVQRLLEWLEFVVDSQDWRQLRGVDASICLGGER